MMAWTKEKISEIYGLIQKKAITDEEFREELLANTNETIEKIAGEALPEGFQVKVIENDPAYAATFVLPPMASGELGEEELSVVAGGDLTPKGCGLDACGGEAKIAIK